MRLRGPLFQDAKAELDACNGSAQLMGDVPQEALLPRNKARQAVGHPVDRSGQLPQFVASVFFQMQLKVSWEIRSVAFVSWETDLVRLRINGNQQTAKIAITASIAISHGLKSKKSGVP